MVVWFCLWGWISELTRVVDNSKHTFICPYPIKVQIYLHRRKEEMFYLKTHKTHFIYGYMVSDIWLRTTEIIREETSCCHFIVFSFWLAARNLLYAQTGEKHTTAFNTPVVAHWLEQEICPTTHICFLIETNLMRIFFLFFPGNFYIYSL